MCCLPRFGMMSYWDLDKKFKPKKQFTFYDVLSQNQKRSLILEEVQTRQRTGISHLSDEVLKKLMLSMGGDSKEASA